MLAPGRGEEAQEVKLGPRNPLPGLTKTLAPQSQGGGELVAGPGPWRRDRTEGGGSRMVSDIWWSQPGEVRPQGQSGLQEGLGQGQHFENVKRP